MRLIMYVDGKEVDAVDLPRLRVSLSELMEDLKTKHKELLKEKGAVVEFVLENVPSRINFFRSLVNR